LLFAAQFDRAQVDLWPSRPGWQRWRAAKRFTIVCGILPATTLRMSGAGHGERRE
jgi:hypothetical protein